ncbi:MAG: glycoside hydrolase family 113 [Myxococcota bacterium]
MRTAIALAIVLLTAISIGCDERTVPDLESPKGNAESSGEDRAAEPVLLGADSPDQAEGRNVTLPAGVWAGVCLAHSWQNDGHHGYGTAASAQTLDHLSALGVGWVSLTPFSWMPSQQAPEIRGEHNGSMPEAAENESRVSGVIEQARARGIRTVLKPHIWIRGGAYRGDIEPRDERGELAWSAWWDSYDAFITYYARQAAELDIPVFFVGVELESAIAAAPERFLETIARVREVYDGELAYSANWDEEQPDRIWSALDYIGVQFYPPLSDAKEPSTDELSESIRAHLQPWTALSRRTDRPVIISEVGFRAAPNAAKNPHHWPERTDEDGKRVDQDLQRRAYVALFSEIAASDRLRGVFIWKYFTYAQTDERRAYGFSPRNYAAEDVLERAYSGPSDTGSE